MIKDLPTKLRLLREAKKLEQKMVAEQLGISPSVVSGYESGEKTPSLEKLLALSRVYGCSTDYLLGRGDTDEPYIRIYSGGLSEKQIAALINLAELMRDKTE